MNGYSWHPTREPYGTVLGAYVAEWGGYPIEASGITFAEACERFGACTIGGEIPITIDRPTD